MEVDGAAGSEPEPAPAAPPPPGDACEAEDLLTALDASAPPSSPAASSPKPAETTPPLSSTLASRGEAPPLGAVTPTSPSSTSPPSTFTFSIDDPALVLACPKRATRAGSTQYSNWSLRSQGARLRPLHRPWGGLAALRTARSVVLQPSSASWRASVLLARSRRVSFCGPSSPVLLTRRRTQPRPHSWKRTNRAGLDDSPDAPQGTGGVLSSDII